MTRDLAAYGVGFVGLGDPGSPEPPLSWPRWTVVQQVGSADESPGMDVWGDRARIGMPSVGEFRLNRDARRIVLHVHEPWGREMLLHPGLAPAASVIAHWMGRASFHAAAVLIDGRVWGLFGDKAAGKSTTLAHLVGLGCGLVTDDLLVVDGTDAFAGPGAVDLRGDVGPGLGGTSLGVIGARERWRAAIDVQTPRAPLAGWVQLEWTQGSTNYAESALPARLEALSANAMVPLAGVHLLDLAALPMWRFTRRYSPDLASEDAGRLLALVNSS